ncbi:hypothetical protein ACFC3F_04590 [Microbacterium sp. NPDC055910]|uniref:hypothetical protein n=1 Tax=Microbacterium sp. NPDC055910 TaxID=3345659 RepID=UPI0035DCE898
MHDVIAALATADPQPTPSMTVDPSLVTPGPLGFAVIVLVVVAVFLLIFDMLRRIRRGRVRADIADELREEAEALDADGRRDAAEPDEDPRVPPRP